MLDFEIALQLETIYDELLDDCYPVYKIGDLTFYPSQILKECDPIAYRCGLSDFESTLEENEEDDD